MYRKSPGKCTPPSPQRLNLSFSFVLQCHSWRKLFRRSEGPAGPAFSLQLLWRIPDACVNYVRDEIVPQITPPPFLFPRMLLVVLLGLRRFEFRLRV